MKLTVFPHFPIFSDPTQVVSLAGTKTISGPRFLLFVIKYLISTFITHLTFMHILERNAGRLQVNQFYKFSTFAYTLILPCMWHVSIIQIPLIKSCLLCFTESQKVPFSAKFTIVNGNLSHHQGAPPFFQTCICFVIKFYTGFNCWFSFAPVFQWCCSAPRGSPGVGRNTFLSSPHLCFIIVFICDLFVSRGDPLMSKYQGGTSVVFPYCYLFLLSVFILWFSYYVSDIFCKC